MPFSLTSPHMISTFPSNAPTHFKYYSHVDSPHPTKLPSSIFTCSASADKTPSRPSPGFDRRDILLGLGGLCSAAANYGHSNQQAGAKPVAPPDIKDCRLPTLPMGAAPTSCCPPPYTGKVIDFKHPSILSPMRRRRPAHLVDDAYAEKYNRAVELMKQLEDSDPRSFRNQANIHCAFCDAAYHQVDFPVEIQVHSSWLFFPWHRFYLYFHERILAKLVGDDSFALPFWNWDSPQGMTLPAIYATHSALRDEHRDPKHQPPALVPLDYNLVDPPNNELIISDNLTIMYRQLLSNGKTAELFLGSPYRAGDAASPGAGSVENIPHNPVHLWVGDRSQPNGEDMGTFYSAARDPIFFAHHGNVDRLWTVWKGLGGKNRKDFDDPDWLNAGFLFYNENAEVVRLKVSDCLDTTKLRYVYEEVELPWLQAKPKASNKNPQNRSKTMDAAFGSDPRTLASTIRASLKRSKWSRTQKEKEEEEEILVVEGIEIRRDVFVKFDIFVNLDADGEENDVGPGSYKCAGSFTNLPHNFSETDGDDGQPMKLKTSLRLGLTGLLEDIGADGDENIEVSLIPKAGNGENITIGGIRIEFGS